MNIQIFGKSKCFDTKKAERWFKERRIRFQAIDLKKYGMSRGELQSVKSAVGLEALVDEKHPDAADFAARLECCRDNPLKVLTDDRHFHTVTAPSEKLLDLIESELRTRGFLEP